ncbi:MAG: Trm112 family protein [Candidatus Lightella neohaematopini]|nr:Trm112 family protein [Candidatus Lightella neohaematopini]MCV2528781.1 Trm112 family protein [Candidatus Lightella neohaematopini]
MNKKLLKIIVCPICKNKLILKKREQELICIIDSLAYPILGNIPILIKDKARKF